MTEKITAQDVMKHGPCQPEWPMKRLQKVLGEGKTLLEILEMEGIEAADRIWCITRFLSDKVNRAFAIWCVRQYKTDCKEVIDYIATKEELSEDDWAASRDRMAYCAARAAYWAARAASSWTGRVGECQKQIEKLKEIVKEIK